MAIDLPPQYDPKSVEAAIYQKWLDAKVFHAVPDERPPEKRFSVVIPPPNVTGALHLGHAINGTIQDILTRYHRMKGDNTMWMPGIDHAGIATQAVVEKTIFEKEKKSRHDLGREELVRRIWKWKEQFGTRILAQLQSIGASCDWERARFTLDDICAKAVREAFFKMFKDGLIFRGKRLVNWDTHLQTAVADDEIYYEPVKGQLTSIKYPVASDDPTQSSVLSPQCYLIVATTRPETMLGDTAVAVHPDDPRFTHLHGKFVILPLIGRKIPVICDGLLVDPKFGTGVVKVTPAHDPNDYATWQRHLKEMPDAINLLTPEGKVNENGQGEFLGKKYSYTGLKFATAARKQVLADLEELGLIAEKKVHEHEIGHSDRSKTPIEPYLSDQWFVRMGDIEGIQKSEPRPLGSDHGTTSTQESLPNGRGSDVPPHSSALAYFITFHTFATWLHGQEPGAVDPAHNAYDALFIPPDPKLLKMKLANLDRPPLELSLAQRQSVLNTIHEVAAFRGWTIHAVNVRSTHAHIVVAGNHVPERMMNDFKSYATRRMVEASLLPPDTKAWSRHGSTRYLWKPEHLSGAIHYTLHEQGENAPGTTTGRQSEPRPLGSDPSTADARSSLPYGRGSDRNSDGITLADGTLATGLAQAAIDAVKDGRVKITPERYAKGYIDWLSQKRDWCISRQLWWGHRIPVWTRVLGIEVPSNRGTLQASLRGILIGSTVSDTTPANEMVPVEWREFVKAQWGSVTLEDGRNARAIHYCVAAGHRDVEIEIEAQAFVRDPDVLDTWFSSALWPLSTMGWPNSEQPSEPRPSGSDLSGDNATRSLPHGRGSDGMIPERNLLPYFYPTSVLSTAREILTLWVARMVMFGLYCHGDVPFKNVYIHAVIQDGEGRPMKKSLGNGVDPVDIVHSHGADALRFTLASMATETQDIRLPVVKDPVTERNTSPKFDIGRNFANKIWNASRFILSNISEEQLTTQSSVLSPQSLEDRWILSRLNTTIESAAAAINSYHFADLAEALRTFFWTDLCDWYLEIAKSRIKSGDAQVQSILLHCLETSLKLLHPLMPFITEELWSKLPHTSAPGSAGGSRNLLITSPWPTPVSLTQSSVLSPQSFSDPAAESQLALIQSVTTAIREIQNRYPAAKGKDVILQPRDTATQKILDQSRSIIEPLANAKIAENSPSAPKPENAATAVLPDGGGVQIFIGGMIDKSAESAKLTKRKTELEKFITANRNKLGNEPFVQKAPAHIIQGLRDQLAKQEEELAAVDKNLIELRQ